MSLDVSNLSSPVTSHLSVLDEAHCQVLRASASALVRRKELLDDLREETKDRWLVPDALPSEHGSSVDSFGFLSVVLPFLDMTPREHEFPARIPTDLTLGECCGRKLDDMAHSERERLLALFSNDDRAFHDEKDTATALWVRPLSLFVVDHGKNRVRFLRSMGESTMPAAVTPLDYPAADRLMIHCVQVAGRQLVWLVLDGQFLRELRCPALSIPFLRAYGVCTSEQWPAHWPEPRMVLEEMDKTPPHKLHIRPIDLLYLGQRLADESRDRKVRFFEIALNRQRLPRFLARLADWTTTSDRSTGKR